MVLINGRTPEEIKQGLIDAIEEASWATEGGDAHDLIDAVETAHGNMAHALAYIQQLENERDAAVKDLKNMIVSNVRLDCCELCKHLEPDGQCFHTCIPYSDKWGWEWRGLREE